MKCPRRVVIRICSAIMGRGRIQQSDLSQTHKILSELRGLRPSNFKWKKRFPTWLPIYYDINGKLWRKCRYFHPNSVTVTSDMLQVYYHPVQPSDGKLSEKLKGSSQRALRLISSFPMCSFYNCIHQLRSQFNPYVLDALIAVYCFEVNLKPSNMTPFANLGSDRYNNP